MSSLRPVLLSGGSGTRLWPLSTPQRPKQFVPLFGGRSLFDLTLARLDGIEEVAAPIVVTGAAHLDLVESALRASGVEDSQVVVEPI
ncbi:MAG: sugar phosphate nucleotidyltransferase, partial [Actinomycetota bacterium]